MNVTVAVRAPDGRMDGEVLEIPVKAPPETLAEVRKLAACAGMFLPPDAGVGTRLNLGAGLGRWTFPCGLVVLWGEVRA